MLKFCTKLFYQPPIHTSFHHPFPSNSLTSLSSSIIAAFSTHSAFEWITFCPLIIIQSRLEAITQALWSHNNSKYKQKAHFSVFGLASAVFERDNVNVYSGSGIINIGSLLRWHFDRSNYCIWLRKARDVSAIVLFIIKNLWQAIKAKEKRETSKTSDAEKAFSMSLLLMVIFYFASP